VLKSGVRELVGEDGQHVIACMATASQVWHAASVRTFPSLPSFSSQPLRSGPSKPPTVRRLSPSGGDVVAPAVVTPIPVTVAATPRAIDAAVIAAATVALIAKHGESHRARIERGVDQVAVLWRTEDGDLGKFVTEQFIADPKAIDALFARLQAQFEQVDGHVLELGRSLRWADIEIGRCCRSIRCSRRRSGAHVTETCSSEVAFVALNFR
jgi:hypothetical protein